ncbi:Uncharacterised protein [Fusobacterium necrogenes]|uniref:Lipoprotein n=1 Tax=Fusobacterium necrogenes TaxID=858 RepID=A0A377GXZ0_9FUSO|nr:hypothetical protein [Fusobacterium necrogenes]STO31421.1 Uncharacterised protein [Fusobacterium necrogenes]
MLRKIFFILTLLLSITACTSYTPKEINNRYLRLSRNLDNLMSDKIVEKKRANLEKNFENFYNGMLEYRNKNYVIDTEYLNYYLEEVAIKLQYLRDLKD